MNESFSAKVVQLRPDLIGRTVWFCVNKSQKLECVVNEDGTISSRCTPDRRFFTAKDLIDSVKTGSIRSQCGEGFKLPRDWRLSSCGFNTHLFFFPNGTKNVYHYVYEPALPLPTESSTANDVDDEDECPGFLVTDPLVKRLDLSSIKIEGDSVRSRRCTKWKRGNALMCSQCRTVKSIVNRSLIQRKLQHLGRKPVHLIESADHQPSSRSQFWRRVIESKPELIGATVYFCPTNQASLACVVRDDGTISPACALDLRFDNASKLVDDLKNGDISDPNFRSSKIRRNWIYTFDRYFFMNPGQQELVKDSIEEEESDGTDDESDQPMDVSEVAPSATTQAENDSPDDANVDENVRRLLKEGSTTTGPAPSPPPTAVPASSEASSMENTDDTGVYACTDDLETGNETVDVKSTSEPANTIATSNSKPAARSSVRMEPNEPENDERFRITKDFWRIAINIKPELVGKTVYFCPTARLHVPCVVNHDGTFSPANDRKQLYSDAAPFIEDIKEGKILLLGANGNMRKTSRPAMSRWDFFFLELHGGDRVVDSLGEFRLCQGIDRAQFGTVVRERRWDGDRSELAPVIVQGEIIRSKGCTLVFFPPNKFRCEACKVARKSLSKTRRKFQQRPPNEEKRLMFSGFHLLTAEDRRKKAELIRREHNLKVAKLAKQAAKVERLEEELKKYKPKHAVNQEAVRGLVSYLNEETEKTTSPTCQWLQENGEICGFMADSTTTMCSHLYSQHHQPQIWINSQRDPDTREYLCLWKDCCRRTPFLTARQLRFHSAEHHVVNKSSIQRLEIMRCQLRNLGRRPQAHRYNETFKNYVLNESSSGFLNGILPVMTRGTRAGWDRKQRNREINGNAEMEENRQRRIDDVIQSVMDTL